MKLARFEAEGQAYSGTVRADGRLETAAGAVYAPEAVRWLPPVTGTKAIGLALNYREHAAELSMEAPPDPRDAAAALMQFESGATGVLATVRAAPMFWRIHVFGTKGSAEAREETSLTTAIIGGQPQTRTFPPVDSLAVLLEAFAETIETGKPFPVTTAEMLDVVGAFEATIRSIAEERPVAVVRA